MTLFALTLLTYFVVRPTGPATHPPRQSRVNSSTAKPKPLPTARRTNKAGPRPHATSTYNAPFGNRRNPSSAPAPTLSIAPTPVVTAQLPVQTPLPPEGGPVPPVGAPPPGPAPDPVPAATGAP
jgi:hypothetical protein